MQFLFPPYRTRARFCHRIPDRAGRFPVPWAVTAENVVAARVLLDCLRCGRGASSGEVVVAGDGRVYVRWSD